MEEYVGERTPLNGRDSRTKIADSKFKVIFKRFGGLLLAVVATFVYAVITLLYKIFASSSPFTVTLWRFEGMLVPSIPLIMVYACLPSTRRNGYSKTFGIGPGVHKFKGNCKLILFLIIRGVFGFASTILQVYAVDKLTMADASVIVYSYPVIVSLLAHFFLGEKAGWSSVLIAILTFVGIVIIAKPPILTGQTAMNHEHIVGILFAVGSMILSAFVIIDLRRLRSVHYSLATVSYALLGTIQSASTAAISGVFVHPRGILEWSSAAPLFVISFIQQASLTLALSLEQAGPVSLILSTDVVFVFIFQFIFLGVVPDKYSLIGASIVLLGVILTSIRKWRQTVNNNNNNNNTHVTARRR